jgi:multidrug efflux pump subunit AcrB
MAGALLSLAIMHTPFGFMAFLGISSLIGVIVSQSVVLFEFIEENHHNGVPLKEALINSCILRMRPVSIAVLATVTALIPLALKGGPLWQPMCYAQIGGLLTAMGCTLLMVPVFYSIFVLDLKLIKWEKEPENVPTKNDFDLDSDAAWDV